MAACQADYDFVRRLVYERSAVALEADKAYLIEARLAPVARATGCADITDLITRIRSQAFNDLHRQVVEALMTNETSFFRDLHPYEALRRVVLPDLITKRGAERAVTVWCGACSSGQEPYTIQMVLREHFPTLASWNVKMLATDISAVVLARAQEGRYNQLEVNRGLPAPLLVKYFERNGVDWQVKEPLRRAIEFRTLNLATTWAGIPRLDLVFLRNVLIYFDVPTKRAILGRVRDVLRPDGYLFLGGAETTLNLDAAFERVPIDKTVCYRLRG
jgi:chemotaxis protein methyltransferase CheR